MRFVVGPNGKFVLLIINGNYAAHKAAVLSLIITEMQIKTTIMDWL
jgi:hypothetical protein